MTEKTKATAADRKPAKGRKPVIRETAKPAPRKKKIKETVVAKPGVAMLIENELERAEVVLAAKSITGKLQDIAEDLSKIEANDLMPMMDSLRGAFGPQRAEQFSQVATAKIRDLITSVQNSKNGIDTEIGRLETEVNGGDPSDAAMDEPPPDAGAAPMSGEEGPPAPDGVPPPDAPPDAPPEPPAIGAEGFAGRARKESVQRKGKPLTETLAHESPEFTAHLDALAEFSPKCFSAAQDILNRIHDLSASGAIRNKLINALGHVISAAGDAAVWDDPESIASHASRSHLVGGAMDEVAKNPEVGTILRDISKLAHLIGFKHEGHLNEDDMMSSASPAPPAAPVPAPTPMSEARRNKNIQRLRESADPDSLILSVFRKVFRECRNPGQAARGTANAFAIDVADVVSIVREAKRMAEEGPALMGVAMGAPVAGSPAAPLTTNTMGQAVGTVDNGPGKPRRPMTPAESRAAAQQRDQQDKAAGNNPKQPIIAPAAAVPVQDVPPGEAPVTITPQAAQQRRANGLTAMPGRTVTNATVRA